jgi:hypothetical protein
MKTGAIVLAALIGSMACQPKDQPPAEQPGDAASASPEDAWTVSIRGYGPIRTGMTLAQAAAAGGRPFSELMLGSIECDYVFFAGDTIAGNAHFMVVHGQIARVDVSDSSIATAEGARIGDSEQRIQELYSGRVSVEPHKYVDGHYLIVAPYAREDSGHAIIFETDGRSVTEFRAGRLPEVRYIEGCS